MAILLPFPQSPMRSQVGDPKVCVGGRRDEAQALLWPCFPAETPACPAALRAPVLPLPRIRGAQAFPVETKHTQVVT